MKPGPTRTVRSVGTVMNLPHHGPATPGTCFVPDAGVSSTNAETPALNDKR